MPTTSSGVALLAVVTTGGCATLTDLRTGRIPNAISLVAAATGFALAGLGLTDVSLSSALFGCGLGFVLMLPLRVVGAMGAGDVKLFSAQAAILGAGRVLEAFCLMAIAGGVLAMMHAWRRNRLRVTLTRAFGFLAAPAETKGLIESSNPANRFAYGPAVAVGGLLAALT